MAEYALQTGGLADALRDRAVRDALLQAPDHPVWFAVYDWSGVDDMRLILDWVAIRDAADIDRIAALLEETPRRPGQPLTAVGATLRFGAAQFGRVPDCPVRTLDLTGDGKNNSGTPPERVTTDAGITVNVLVIGPDHDDDWDGVEPGIAELSAWFMRQVIRGPDAFVETALGYQDFRDAMTRKLLREIVGMRIGTTKAAKEDQG
jgi:hypothetical protein